MSLTFLLHLLCPFVCGNITTPTLVIEQGGLFDGTCKMGKGTEGAEKKVALIKEKEAAGETVLDFQDEG